MKFVVEISASFSDKIVDLSKYLTTFVVNSDYNNKIMPMWAFSFKMPYSIKNLLQEGDFTLPFRVFSIKSSNSESDDPYASNDDIIYDEVIYEDEIIEYSKTYSNVKQFTDEGSGEGVDMKTIPYTVSGLSKNIMEINSSVLNGNYRNTISLNALKASMQDLNKKITVVTSNDNLATEYKQIIIPPMNLVPAIKHLIRYYPIYSSSTGVFFNDKDTLHIFTDTVTSLKTRVDVDVVDNSQQIQFKPNDFILTKKNENYYTYKTTNTPVFETIKKVNDNELGINKEIYRYDDMFNIRSGNVNDKSNVYDKKRVYWDGLGDESTTQMIKDRYNRNRISSISFSNVDPHIFNQYTYINLDGEDSIEYLKGKYAVKNKTEVYSSSSDNYIIFTNEITVVIENVVE